MLNGFSSFSLPCSNKNAQGIDPRFEVKAPAL